MSDATGAFTIRPDEAAHFGALAADWWDPDGTSAMLHRINPVRLRFVREAIDRHWGGDPRGLRPLAGRSVLDVGCGAGLICEPLARLGGEVTGVDAAPENTAAAAAHAETMGLDIRYLSGELATLDLGTFDLVTCLEVIEHVADKPAFLRALVQRMEKDGLLVLSTPNRTATSRLLLSGAAEAVGAIPHGTHDWNDFVTPDELARMLGAEGLTVTEQSGLSWRPDKGFYLSDDTSLNYIVSARFA